MSSASVPPFEHFHLPAAAKSTSAPPLLSFRPQSFSSRLHQLPPLHTNQSKNRSASESSSQAHQSATFRSLSPFSVSVLKQSADICEREGRFDSFRTALAYLDGSKSEDVAAIDSQHKGDIIHLGDFHHSILVAMQLLECCAQIRAHPPLPPLSSDSSAERSTDTIRPQHVEIHIEMNGQHSIEFRFPVKFYRFNREASLTATFSYRLTDEKPSSVCIGNSNIQVSNCGPNSCTIVLKFPRGFGVDLKQHNVSKSFIHCVIRSGMGTSLQLCCHRPFDADYTTPWSSYISDQQDTSRQRDAIDHTKILVTEMEAYLSSMCIVQQASTSALSIPSFQNDDMPSTLPKPAVPEEGMMISPYLGASMESSMVTDVEHLQALEFPLDPRIPDSVDFFLKIIQRINQSTEEYCLKYLEDAGHATNSELDKKGSEIQTACACLARDAKRMGLHTYEFPPNAVPELCALYTKFNFKFFEQEPCTWETIMGFMETAPMIGVPIVWEDDHENISYMNPRTLQALVSPEQVGTGSQSSTFTSTPTSPVQEVTSMYTLPKEQVFMWTTALYFLVRWPKRSTKTSCLIFVYDWMGNRVIIISGLNTGLNAPDKSSPLSQGDFQFEIFQCSSPPNDTHQDGWQLAIARLLQILFQIQNVSRACSFKVHSLPLHGQEHDLKQLFGFHQSN